jgi:YD repeat-containing protein
MTIGDIINCSFHDLDRHAAGRFDGSTVRHVTLTDDAEGQMLTQADFLNRVPTYTYNSCNGVASVTDSLGNISTCSYTAAGKRVERDRPVQRLRHGATERDAPGVETCHFVL